MKWMEFAKRNWPIFVCILCLVLAFIFISEWSQRVPVIVSIALFFVSTQSLFAAQASAQAAQASARLAADNQRQAIYVHLATLWYQIKQRGLESPNFLALSSPPCLTKRNYSRNTASTMSTHGCAGATQRTVT